MTFTGAQASAEPHESVLVTRGQGADACPRDALCLYEHRDYNASGQGDIWIVKSDVPDLGKWGGSNVVSSIVLNSTDPDSRAYLYDLATPGLNGGVGSVWLKVSNRARIPDLREVLVYEKKLVEQPGYNDTVVTDTA